MADDFLVRSDASPPVPSLSIDDVTVLEGDAGTQDAVFTVSLSAASEQDVRVGFSTADGTALSGSDYVAVSGVLLFQGGETTQTIRVPIVGDAISEAAGQLETRAMAGDADAEGLQALYQALVERCREAALAVEAAGAVVASGSAST